MSQPSKNVVHVDQTLTNISVAYFQSPALFVAQKVFPSIGVNKATNKYWVLPRDAQTRDEVQKRAPGAQTAGTDWTLSSDSYDCEVFGLHQDLTEQVLSNADEGTNLFTNTANILAEKMLIHLERKFVATYFGTSIWGTDMTGVSATPTGDQFLQWNDDASDPVTDVKKANRLMQLKTGRRGNVLTVSREVHDVLTENADVKTRIQYQGGAPTKITNSHLAELFEVSEINILDASYNTAAEGVTANYAWMAGKGALLTHRPASPGLMTPSAGYMFEWNGFNGPGVACTRVSRYDMIETRSTRVEIERAYDMKVVGADLGVFFATAVA